MYYITESKEKIDCSKDEKFRIGEKINRDSCKKKKNKRQFESKIDRSSSSRSEGSSPTRVFP